jgi:hypothetical protein
MPSFARERAFHVVPRPGLLISFHLEKNSPELTGIDDENDDGSEYRLRD